MKTGAGRAVWAQRELGRSRQQGLENEAEGGEKLKYPTIMVTGGIPRARLRAGGRRRGLRARAARCGGPDAEGASSTTRGRGRSRRTPRSRDHAAWPRGRVRKG